MANRRSVCLGHSAVLPVMVPLAHGGFAYPLQGVCQTEFSDA